MEGNKVHALEEETALQIKHYPTAEEDEDIELKEELVARSINISKAQAESKSKDKNLSVKPLNIRKADYKPPIRLDGLTISIILEDPKEAQRLMGDKKDDFKKISGQIPLGMHLLS